MVRCPLPAAAVLLCLALGGCAAGEPSPPASTPPARWTTYHDEHRGYTVTFPADWHRAQESLTPALTDPREIVSVSTVALPHRASTNCQAFAGAAREALGATDVLVTIQERGYDRSSEWSEFRPRPSSFDTGGTEPPHPGCGDRPGTETWWRPFTDAGRHFYALVVIGPGAPRRVHDEAFGASTRCASTPASSRTGRRQARGGAQPDRTPLLRGSRVGPPVFR